ncbi:MAG: prolipoprotein diacylglyceryl transferase family protein [Myxococcota bacterium]
MYPVLFRIGWFELSSFGVMVAVAMLVGARLAARAFEDEGLPGDAAWRVLTWCIVGGLVGSKLWFVAEQMARYPGTPMLDSLFSRAGLTWYGGLLGGAAAAYLGFRANGIDPLRGFNASAPTAALGHAIGRIGCLLVGDDYGRPTELPWGIAFPQGTPPTDVPVHPTMVYETLWLLPAALWLWRRRRSSPFLFGEYMILSAVGRLWIEILRTNPSVLGGLTNAQLVAIVFILIAAAGWIYSHRQTSSA